MSAKNLSTVVADLIESYGNTAKNATAAQLAFSAYYTKGLSLTTQGAQQVVNQLVKVAEAGVERAAAKAA